MGLRELLAKYLPPTDKIRGTLPQVMLFGTEKTYGTPQPQDFGRQIEANKSWAYACAWKNAVSVAKCKLCLYKQTLDKASGEEKLEKILQHPFLDVINSVNPFSNRFELFTITQNFMEITGNAYWWIPRDTFGVPYMIWNIPAHWVKIVPSKTKFIEGYVVSVPGKGQPVPFDEEEVIHFKFPSPFSMFYGSGPMIAAQYGVDLNSNMKEWVINFFMNNAQPSGILSTEGSLNAEQYQRLKDRWNEKYRGAQNAGKTAILEKGLEYQQVGSSLKDTRYDQVTTEMRDEICAMFGVPASKLGLESHDNRATAEASDFTYQNETILPRLTLIEEKLNEKFISIYQQDAGVKLVVRFDNPVPQDKAQRLQERQINISTGYSSIDDERIADGLEPYDLPETKVPLIPFGLNPAGTPKEEQTGGFGTEEEKSVKKSKDRKWERFVNTTAPHERYFTEIMKRYFQSQQSEVMRNVAKFRSVSKDLGSHIFFNLGEQNEKLKQLAKPTVRNAYVAGLTLGVSDTNHAIDFNLFEPNILRAVEQRIGFFANKINESTLQQLNDELQAGLEGGESINEIAKRIDQVFQRSNDFRSKRIAQTEVIGATNDGQLRAYMEAGVEQKEWLTARDEKVRESHQIDGQTVGITDSFTTGDGNKLRYPGDRSSGADASDIISCRCTVVPVI